MLIKHPSDIPSSEITPKAIYLRRREFLRAAALAGAGAALGGFGGPAAAASMREPIANVRESRFSTDEPPTSLDDITSYNNFYELGTGKDDPKRFAHMMTTDPWSIEIGGLVERPGTYDLADILRGKTIEERIYRFRCVERWAMVVPWNGFELSDLLEMAGVQSGAKYVAFETAMRPDEMPGLASPVIDWPYVEGLRLDEAMHPLTMVATGMYGKDMPKQNGAPLRLVVPWKYGYKSIKSIVRITLTDSEPPTAWNKYAPNEYGFYSNVNPNRDHPRWSQKYEQLLGSGLFAEKIPTRMFNGYEEEVASLYEGMDLIKFH
jgi:sulfoxide reductase catalytic subunit YedY